MKEASFRKEVYFCSHCKKFVDSINKLYFVDEVPRGFCSEKCIEKYFMPIVQYYEKVEQKLREKYLITYEEIFDHIGDPELIAKVLTRPEKLTYFSNHLGETIYSFVLKFNEPPMPPFYYIILAHLFDHRPAFILLATATTNENFVHEFLFDQLVELPEKFLKTNQSPLGDFASQQQVNPNIKQGEQEQKQKQKHEQGPEVQEEAADSKEKATAKKNEKDQIEEFERTANLDDDFPILSGSSGQVPTRSTRSFDAIMPFDVEQKKSILLAELLENRRPEDIPFEKFHLYDHFIGPTLEHPDQIFKTKDEDGDELLVHRKNIKGHPVEFAYLVIAVLVEKANGRPSIVPIISFPTIDNNLATAYCQGVLVNRFLPN